MRNITKKGAKKREKYLKGHCQVAFSVCFQKKKFGVNVSYDSDFYERDKV